MNKPYDIWIHLGLGERIFYKKQIDLYTEYYKTRVLHFFLDPSEAADNLQKELEQKYKPDIITDR